MREPEDEMGSWTSCPVTRRERHDRELKYKKRPKGYSLVHRGSILNVKFWETVYGSICFSNCADHLREVLKKYGNLKWHLPLSVGPPLDRSQPLFYFVPQERVSNMSTFFSGTRGLKNWATTSAWNMGLI